MFPLIKWQTKRTHLSECKGFSYCMHANWKMDLKPETKQWTRSSKHCHSLAAIIVMHWGKMLQHNQKMFPSGAGDPAAYYFPCFSWHSFYWDFAIWLPRSAKMVRPKPILVHWCMQSFQELRLRCGSKNVLSLRSWENQCKVKPNKSRASVSVWINVHSVWKIPRTNTINFPQRCQIISNWLSTKK